MSIILLKGTGKKIPPEKQLVLLKFVAWAIPIILSIFLYIKSEKKVEPVFSILKSPSLIFDKRNISPRIRMLSEDSSVIKDDIYLSTIAIWNKGKVPIQVSDVRNDFQIALSDTTSRILDYEILKQTEEEFSKFELVKAAETIKIIWKYFDPTYGLLIQIIYSGDEHTKILVSGNSNGVNIKEVIPKTKSKRRNTIIISLIIILFALNLWNIYTELPITEEDRINKIFNIILFSLVIAALVYFFRNTLFSINIPFD